MNRLTLTALIFCSLICLLAAPAYAASDSPYLIEKKDFKKKISSVALSPLDVPDMIPLSADMRTFLETEAAKALAKKKISNQAMSEYAAIYTNFSNQIGGLRNAEGELDAKRRALVRDHARREMRLQHAIDGFAEIALVAVSAQFSEDRAEWDGVKRKVISNDRNSLFGGGKYQGSIAGVSFQLAVYDRNDKLLYLQRSGIDLLQTRQGDRLMLRDDDFLNDTKQLKKSVQSAFKPL